MFISGYGTSDFNKALKGTNVAAIQKGLDFQRKQLAKRKPKDAKGIAADTAQIAAAEKRLAELNAVAAPAVVSTSAPVVSSSPKMDPTQIPSNVSPPSTVPAIVAPPVASSPRRERRYRPTVSPVPQAQAPAPSVAPPPAAESFAAPLAQAPTLFTPAPTATPDTAQAAAPEAPSKIPMIVGAVAVGLGLLYLSKKKK